MKRKRFSEEQIVEILQAVAQSGQGGPEACREQGIAENTYYRWRRKYGGVDVLNPVQPECMDLARLKREFGRDLTFWGGLSTQTTLPFGTHEEVRQEARAVRDLLGKGGGLIFASAQELQADVPFANIEALLEVARETDGHDGCR